MSTEAREISSPQKKLGRYTILQQIAVGGMGTVHLARLRGPTGASRVVAVKHLYPHLSSDPEFRAMLTDEVRLVSHIRHPNVVPTLEVVVSDAEILLVMEYIHGDALSTLRRAAEEQQHGIPLAVCSAILIGALHGLHAAHEARNAAGKLLDLVHRDVSPPHIMVSADGVAMMLDFGVAKAMQARHEARSGLEKGEPSYMSPEQIRGEPLTPAADIFGASVVLWELLTTRSLFGGSNEHERTYRVLQGGELTPPSALATRIPAGLDDVVMKGLRANPAERYRTALEMATAIEQKIPPASARVVGEWVSRTAAESLDRKAELLRRIEIADIAVPAILAEQTVSPRPGSGPNSRPGSGPAPRTAPAPAPVADAADSRAQATLLGTAAAPAPAAAITAEVAQPKPSQRRDPRAFIVGVLAALVVAAVVTLARRPFASPTIGAPAAAGEATASRHPSFGTTVIIKPPPPPGRPAPGEGTAQAFAPTPPAPTPEGPAGAAAEGAGDRQPLAPAAKPAREPGHDRTVVRRSAPTPAATGRPARPHPAAAGAPTTEEPGGTLRAIATPARSADGPRSPAAPTSDLKKRVPLVDDHPRVQILE